MASCYRAKAMVSELIHRINEISLKFIVGFLKIEIDDLTFRLISKCKAPKLDKVVSKRKGEKRDSRSQFRNCCKASLDSVAPASD